MQNLKRPWITTIIVCLTASVGMFASTYRAAAFIEDLRSSVSRPSPAAVPAPPASVVRTPATVLALVPQNASSFHFIEPLATRSGDPSKFDASLLNYLTVEVCEVVGSDCTVVKSFSSHGTSSEQLRIESSGGWTYYIANWDTQKFNLNRKTYRVRVNFAGLQLGSVELSPDVYTRFGRTWPIKFMIEKDPALRVRLVRWLGQSCSKAASVLKLEFNLSASEAAAVLAADPQPCSASGDQVAIDGVYQDAIIPATTKVSDDATRPALTSYDKGTGRLTFSTETPLLKRLSVNDVLASEPGPNAPSGYLRKITSKRKDQGRIILETVQAKLTEAITRGTLNASGDIIAAAPPALRADSGIVFDSGEKPLAFDGLGPIDEGYKFNHTVTIDETINLEGGGGGTTGTGTIHITGFAYFNAGYNVGIGIEDCFDHFPPVCVDRFEAWGGFEQRSHIRVEGDFNGELHKEKVIYPIPLNPILFFIGPVPVVLVPKVDVVLGVDGHAHIHFVYEAEANSNVKAGAKWTDPGDNGRGWEDIFDDKVLSYKPIADDLVADLHVEARAKLNAGIFLYDLLGPGMDGAVNISADVQTGRKPYWTIDGRLTSGVKFGGGVDDLLGIGTVAEHRFPDLPFHIAQSVNAPPVFSNIRTGAIQANVNDVVYVGPGGGFGGKNYDVADPEGDIPTITASSPGGTVTAGPRIRFTTPGLKTVKITARDAENLEATIYIGVNVRNATPSLTITPTSGSISEGSQYWVAATAYDPEEKTLPCSRIRWSVTAPDVIAVSSSKSSCAAVVKFHQQGDRTIVATATDSLGAAITQTVHVNVTPPPANQLPEITLDSFSITAVSTRFFSSTTAICLAGGICEVPDGGLLHNGQDGDFLSPLVMRLDFSDPDGDPVAIQWHCATGTQFAPVTYNGDGSYSCSPVYSPTEPIQVWATIGPPPPPFGDTQTVIGVDSEVRTFYMLQRVN